MPRGPLRPVHDGDFIDRLIGVVKTRQKKTIAYRALAVLLEDLRKESTHGVGPQDAIDRMHVLQSVLTVVEDSLVSTIREKERRSREPR